MRASASDSALHLGDADFLRALEAGNVSDGAAGLHSNQCSSYDNLQ